MRKLILYSSIFFIYVATALICNCHLFTDIPQQEVIKVNFPEWPPEDDYFNSYPELSRWKIQIDTSEYSRNYFTQDNFLYVTVQKNQPACILISPVTINAENKESCFFKPAGALYPYCNLQNANLYSDWNQGFSADLMHRMFQSRKETGIDEEKLNIFIARFNWKKLCENLEGKIIKAENNETSPAFNPWNIDSARILDNLCFGNFQANYLNMTGGFNYQLEEDFFSNGKTVLSTFIPENYQLCAKRNIYLKKEEPNYLSDGKNYCLILKGKSIKNISREYINMPIYIEGL